MELHRKLLADRHRNSKFAQALQGAVKRGSHVADIGAGTGLFLQLRPRALALSRPAGYLSFLACSYGAGKCYLYEADREVPARPAAARRAA